MNGRCLKILAVSDFKTGLLLLPDFFQERRYSRQKKILRTVFTITNERSAFSAFLKANVLSLYRSSISVGI